MHGLILPFFFFTVESDERIDEDEEEIVLDKVLSWLQPRGYVAHPENDSWSEKLPRGEYFSVG